MTSKAAWTAADRRQALPAFTAHIGTLAEDLVIVEHLIVPTAAAAAAAAAAASPLLPAEAETAEIAAIPLNRPHASDIESYPWLG